jgi:hypothetical protein
MKEVRERHAERPDLEEGTGVSVTTTEVGRREAGHAMGSGQ